MQSGAADVTRGHTRAGGGEGVLRRQGSCKIYDVNVCVFHYGNSLRQKKNDMRKMDSVVMNLMHFLIYHIIQFDLKYLLNEG